MQDRGAEIFIKEEPFSSDLIHIVLKAMAITRKSAEFKPNKIHERSQVSVAIQTDKLPGHRIDLPGTLSFIIQANKHLDGAGHRR